MINFTLTLIILTLIIPKLNLFWYETDDLIAEEIPLDSDVKSRIYTNLKGVNAYGFEAILNYKNY